jgi:HAD superfamily hydrolase (TIGR01459 family)
MVNIPNPPLVDGLRVLAGEYRALLCDVWGVIHDGVRAHAEAANALQAFRKTGGTVVLITNAPRPKDAVVAQLDRFGVPRDAYDDVITSGEVARSLLAEQPGVGVHHVGPDRDLPLYDGLDVRLVGDAECTLVSCTGLVDDTTESPDDYAASMRRWRQHQLPMLCANPDIVVERGDRLIWCAGALAERYRTLGGEATVVGKPYGDIYRVALSSVGGGERVLAVGDSMETDIRGAVNAGLDAAFVTGGIHWAAFGRRADPDLAAVHAALAEAGLAARAVMARLAWGR